MLYIAWIGYGITFICDTGRTLETLFTCGLIHNGGIKVKRQFRHRSVLKYHSVTAAKVKYKLSYKQWANVQRRKQQSYIHKQSNPWLYDDGWESLP